MNIFFQLDIIHRYTAIYNNLGNLFLLMWYAYRNTKKIKMNALAKIKRWSVYK